MLHENTFQLRFSDKSLNVYIKMMHMWVDRHAYNECRELWLLVIELAGTGAPQAVVSCQIGCYEIIQDTTSLCCVLNHKTSVSPRMSPDFH